MTSFYGGMPGQSCIIRESYKSFNDMESAFADNSSIVWYDDYVIIDTPNKNDKDNGKIYKRVAPYTIIESGIELTRHSIYIGQIVGPASGLPHIVPKESFAAMDNVPGSITENHPDYYYYDGSGNLYHDGYKSDMPRNVLKQNLTLSNQSLVPGKNENTYNDSISWKWCSIRTDNAVNDAYMYIGFQIPYPWFEIGATSVPHTKTATATITNKEGKNTHPFWWKISLKIPRGVPAVSVANYEIKEYNSTVTYLTPSAFAFSGDILSVDTTKKFVLPSSGYKSNAKIITYKVYSGQEATKANSPYLVAELYDVIENISLNTSNGVLTKDYSAKVSNSSTQLDWVKGISLNNVGDITYTHTVPSSTTTVTSAMTWVTNVALNENTGHLDVDFNNNKVPSIDKNLTWVKNIEIVPTSGVTTITKTTSTATTTLKWPTSMSINASNGKVTTNYTTGSSTTQTTALTWPTDLKMLDSGQIQVKKTTADWTNLPNGLVNYIKDIFVRKSDYHVLVEYATSKTGYITGRYEDINGNYHPSTTGQTKNYNDLGATKDASGLLIGTEESSTPSSGQTVEQMLNIKYPHGLGKNNSGTITNANLLGKVISYKPTGVTEAVIYAFNYNTDTPATTGGYNGWFNVGSLSGGKTKITMEYITSSNTYNMIFNNVEIG